MIVDPGIIDVPPAAPSRLTDADAAYVVKADAWMAFQPTLRAQMNTSAAATYQNALDAQASATTASAAAVTATAAAAAAVSATNRLTTISTSLTPGAGAKNLTGLPSTLAAVNGEDWTLVSASDNRIRMHGPLSSVTLGAGTATLTVPSGGYSGTGAHTDWILVDSRLLVPLGDAADVRAGAASGLAVSAKALADAAAFGTLTDASTIAWDVDADGFNAKLTLTANGHTMGAPTNLKDGLTYTLDINPATYSLAGWNAVFDFGEDGAPVLPASAWSKVTGQYNAGRGKLECSVRRGA